jgi:hypothetical protein
MKLRNSTNLTFSAPIPGEHVPPGIAKTIDVRGGDTKAFSKSELELPQVKAALMAGLLVEDKSGEPVEVSPSGKVKIS